VQSGGALQATPHCVRAATGTAAAGVARNAFAVFMQPRCAARGRPALAAACSAACDARRALSRAGRRGNGGQHGNGSRLTGLAESPVLTLSRRPQVGRAA